MDDLNAPLGQGTPKKQRLKLPIASTTAFAGVLALTLGVFALWAVTADNPLGGEPMAIVAANPPVTTPKKSDTTDAQSSAAADTAPHQAAPAAPSPTAEQTSGRIITIIDGSSGKRQDVVIPGPPGSAEGQQASKPAAAAASKGSGEARLLEPSRHGPIPRIATDGARASEVYARAAKSTSTKPETPRIAIIVGGLGISASTTAEALAKLPGAVTLAFTPYAGDLDRLVARARGEGREVLLQVPMEPFDYPDNDPGPQTMLTSLSAEQNVDRMHWLLSRMQGYVGVMNAMGARFTATEQAIAPILRETNKRGLIYVDDGSSPRSLAGQIAGANNLPFAKGDIILDAVPTSTEIDRALARLESLARERGFAVGVSMALPLALDRLTQWAKTAESRGLLLVPVSAVAVKAKSS